MVITKIIIKNIIIKTSEEVITGLVTGLLLITAEEELLINVT